MGAGGAGGDTMGGLTGVGLGAGAGLTTGLTGVGLTIGLFINLQWRNPVEQADCEV